VVGEGDLVIEPSSSSSAEPSPVTSSISSNLAHEKKTIEAL
jgi:hypothetical protein